MKAAHVFVNGVLAGVLEKVNSQQFIFSYLPEYKGAPVSLTMPLSQKIFEYNGFPPFFEGLLPEGVMLEALLKKYKLDRNDYFAQLIQVGEDVVGAASIKGIK